VVSGGVQLQVPDGYQQTEVGVIPGDWNMVSYDENFSIISGVGFNKSEYSQSGLKLLRIDNVSYGVITWDSIAYLPKSYSNRYQSLILKRKDILLALNRPITNGKLKMAFVKDDDLPSILYQRVGKIIFLNDRVDKVYAFYILTKFIKQFVEQTAVGTDQPFISTTKLKKCKIPIPSDSGEQTAIANALSDVDALITSLEKLIAKKRAIKTATMQQLLTGKKRLPPFDQAHTGYKQTELGEIPADWEVVELGAIGQNLIGLTYSPNDVVEHGTLVLRSSNVQKNKLAFQNNVFVDMELPNRVIVKEGDILICVRNGSKQLIGKCALIDKKTEGVAFGAFMSIYRTEFSSFIFYQFQSNIIQRQIDEIMGATINQITNKDMAVFKVPLPNDTNEQLAISNVLSDMDTEIDALEQRLKKIQQLKQGMMQELLTGRTRLL
jgi:type I restriction enzyme S subunit